MVLISDQDGLSQGGSGEEMEQVDKIGIFRKDYKSWQMRYRD